MKTDSSFGVVGEQAATRRGWVTRLVRFLGKNRRAGHTREFVLIICFVLLVLMFSVTALVSRLYHKKIHTLADQWYDRGEVAFHVGDAKSAAGDYRNALVYSPNNSVFQLHLAQALVAAGRFDEARSYLVNLLNLSHMPSSALPAGPFLCCF